MLPARLPLALLVLAALAIAGAFVVPGCRTADLDGAVASADDSWVYVGDEACASCHAEIYTDYHTTGMGRAVSRFDAATAPERFGADGRSPQICTDEGYCYRAFVRGDTLFQEETRPDTPGYARTYAASHVVGSGNATRSYLMTVADGEARADADGGYVTEMPLTWYVERGIWEMSPGYRQNNARFERPVNAECLTCHDGRPEHEPSQNFFADVPLGITCERCHGPASAHVAAFDAGEPEDTRIVNPAELSPQLELDVCQQCHLTGQTVYAPGESPLTYRPGRPLAAHRAVYVTTASLEDPESFGIASHAERMRRSACFEETAGLENAMTCTTCHDPHRPAETNDYNATCQSCHTPQASGDHAAAGGAEGGHTALCSREGAETPAMAAAGDCVSCHMRTAGTSDIPHVSFTDHWIQRRPPPDEQGGALDPAAMRRETPFVLRDLSGGERDPAEADLALGIALFALYETEHRLPAYLPQVEARIRAGLDAGADRPDARVALGRALLEMGRAADGAVQIARAAAMTPDDPYAHLWLGLAHQAAGDAAAAAESLGRAAELAPRLTEARLALASALADAGRLPDATATLAAALAQDPLRHAGAWNDLGLYRLQQGQFADARAALRRSVGLDPTLVTAHVNLGAAALQGGDLGAAARAFEAALARDPRHTPALGNLGVVRARQGRPADARVLFERLLAIDPNDGQARAYLAELDA